MELLHEVLGKLYPAFIAALFAAYIWKRSIAKPSFRGEGLKSLLLFILVCACGTQWSVATIKVFEGMSFDQNPIEGGYRFGVGVIVFALLYLQASLLSGAYFRGSILTGIASMFAKFVAFLKKAVSKITAKKAVAKK